MQVIIMKDIMYIKQKTYNMVKTKKSFKFNIFLNYKNKGEI